MAKKAILLLLIASGAVKAQVITETFGTGANAFSIDFVQIGNPGNTADTTGNPAPAGKVDYTYNIGKYEISRGIIEKANSAGSLGITLFDMSSYGGNGLNRPATGVSWNEAARFVNYLNTSKGYQAAYNFTTSGANDNITLWGAGQYSGNNQFRHKNAVYFLPSIDEWYKAAYFNPTNNVYSDYPNGTDSPSQSVTSGTTGAVWGFPNGTWGGQGPADINQAGDLSPYGAMAMGGNVYEINETAWDLQNDNGSELRAQRGGSWNHLSDSMSSSSWSAASPADSQDLVGFRIAMLPEPSALSLLAVGLGGLAMMRRRWS